MTKNKSIAEITALFRESNSILGGRFDVKPMYLRKEQERRQAELERQRREAIERKRIEEEAERRRLAELERQKREEEERRRIEEERKEHELIDNIKRLNSDLIDAELNKFIFIKRDQNQGHFWMMGSCFSYAFISLFNVEFKYEEYYKKISRDDALRVASLFSKLTGYRFSVLSLSCLREIINDYQSISTLWMKNNEELFKECSKVPELLEDETPCSFSRAFLGRLKLQNEHFGVFRLVCMDPGFDEEGQKRTIQKAIEKKRKNKKKRNIILSCCAIIVCIMGLIGYLSIESLEEAETSVQEIENEHMVQPNAEEQISAEISKKMQEIIDDVILYVGNTHDGKGTDYESMCSHLSSDYREVVLKNLEIGRWLLSVNDSNIDMSILSGGWPFWVSPFENRSLEMKFSGGELDSNYSKNVATFIFNCHINNEIVKAKSIMKRENGEWYMDNFLIFDGSTFVNGKKVLAKRVSDMEQIVQEVAAQQDIDPLIEDFATQAKESKENGEGDDTVYDRVGTPAEFPGDYSVWIHNNLEYPSRAAEQGVQGRVQVRFIVEKDGSVSNPVCLRNPSGDKDIEKEAIRVVASMPKWRPAKIDDKVVRSYFVLPVTFRLN